MYFLLVCVLNRFSRVQFFATPWTVAHQVPLSMGFSRQEYGSGLPCPPPRDLPNPGIKPRPPSLQADSLQTEPPGKPKNTGVVSLSLLQGDLPDPGTELGSPALHILCQLSYQGTPLTHRYFYSSFSFSYTNFNLILS